MTILSELYRLLIGPLELFFDCLYAFSYRVLGDPGLSIIVLSLGMNILVLPLYRRADLLQAEAREKESALQPWVRHIKKTFKGDERFMLLQTYYRENGYAPTDALKGSVSLLLEVPFFIAAYRFLSGLELLQGVSFGPIRDLGAPDGLLRVGSTAVNVLPILMTVINLISAAVYLQGSPLKDKLQMAAVALVFLVLLYGSPAGLVFYWTLNNVFSLGKNIFYKLKDPARALRWLCSGLGAAGLAAFLLRPPESHRMLALALAALLQAPMALWLLRRRLPRRESARPREHSRSLFRLGGLALTLLIGVLIPAAVIRSSPEEFMSIYAFRSPLWYVLHASLLAAGTFLVWAGIFYELSSAAGKLTLEVLIWIGALCALIDYLFFGADLGTLSPLLQFDRGLVFSRGEILLNILALAAAVFLGLLIWRKKKDLAKVVLIAAAIAMICLCTVDLVHIQGTALALKARLDEEMEQQVPSIPLSREGKNVVVIMLDRAISGYIPYCFHEKPELKEQFTGFVYYPNTLSFGGITNVGAPGLFGGYAYTPLEMDRRSDQLLADKHNEALKVMPYLFDDAGYKVTVCDPPYAGYRWIPDLSIYQERPDIRAYITRGRYVADPAETAERIAGKLDRNFFCYGLMKALPLALQPTFYNAGNYSASVVAQAEAVQTRTGLSTASGIDHDFLEAYTVLTHLPEITVIEDGPGDTFLMLTNDTVHDPVMLQEPAYVPAESVDNRDYDAAHPQREADDGSCLTLSTQRQVIFYQCDMASLLLLGEWFDAMRESGVYDNTRIILVSDHGSELDHQFPELSFFDGELDAARYQALLLVKDFDSDGEVRTDWRFMTNADVPALAMAGLIRDPRDPFTHRPIGFEEKGAPELFVSATDQTDVNVNNGTTFLPDPWWAVRDDIFVESNWRLIPAEAMG
ncbi:MAG: YidC/Oxa1 family membrane protein insertase [Oscillospiraceae bacterium]|nr:YidC/Oxa1 family membrane protein insertase [Oscillospiraceae bacterium]